MKHKKEEEMVRRIKMLIVTAIGISWIVLPLTLQAKPQPKPDGHNEPLKGCICGGDECFPCNVE